MDFCWAHTPEELYGRVLELTQTRVNPLASRRSNPDRFEREEWRLCAECGLLGLCVPAMYGGGGFDVLTTAHAIEAFGRGCHDMGLVFSASAHLFACAMPIAEFGGEELKTSLLPRLCSGEWIGANGITEAEAGSDAFALTTTAVRDGDDYVVNGVKTYVTNGPIADVIVVYASTDPLGGHLGATAFVIEKDTPGVVVGEPLTKSCLVSAPASSLHFNQCRVPAAHRLLGEGQGARVFQRSMQWERSCLFASYLGAMERQLEETIAYARTRRQFGRAIGRNQAVSHRIVNMKMRLEAARLLLYRACWLLDRRQDADLGVSMAKVAVSEAAIQSSLDALHIHGGNGVIGKPHIEQQLHDAIPSSVFSGTSEVQRDLIARELGL